MPRKQWKSISDMVSQLATGIDSSDITSKKFIPDIITFCEHEDYLDMKSSKIDLYPMQRIMLKVFYRGSVGNELLKLTEEEIEMCRILNLDNPDNGDVLGKYNSIDIFRELVLVWGRRSGKDFISSVVALYEAMKLLECEGGDPYSVYGIGSANPITILTIATAREQADIAFQEVKDKLLRSRYFKDKIGPDGIQSQSICLLTSKDRKDNEEYKERKLPTKKGSIVIEVGHSNSDSLLGKSIFVLILDEVASYKNTGGSSGGDRIYTALTPSLNTFVRDEVYVDQDGKTVVRKVYDSKIVSISSPRGQDGVFYNIFKESDNVPSRLGCRLPTWAVNPNQKEEFLRATNSNMTEEMFQMEFGAEFSGTASESFFPREVVEKCFTHSLKLRDIGEPGKVYFAHLDPATSSHNYALVVLHKEFFIHPETKKADFVVVIDHVKYWQPDIGKPINEEEIDEYVIGLRRRFHLALVTYDQWNTCHYLTKMCSPNGLKKAIDFNIGDEIYNRFGKLEKILDKKIDENADCLKVKTKFGYEVIVTKNHPFWSIDKFVHAGDLEVGDKVSLQDFNCFGKVDRVDDALLSGYLVSEGSLSKTGYVSFTNTDQDVLNDFKNILHRFKYSYKEHLKKSYKKHYLNSYDISFDNKFSKDIIERCDFSGIDCHSKKIPDFVMMGNKETVSSFLSSLFEGDGGVCLNANNLKIEYNTVSEKLARDIQLLLLCFGIKSSLKYFTNKYFRGKVCPFYRVSIYGENIDIFSKEIGFRSNRKIHDLDYILNLKNNIDLRNVYNRKNRGIRKIIGKKNSRSRQMWDRIVSIEPVSSTICHLEVSGDHTYISNGIVSHNSSKSIEKLRKHGMPAKKTAFSKRYKNIIYDELYRLAVGERLKIPYHNFLKGEMLNLQRKYTPNGYRVYPKRDGEYTTDDIVDCVAGACYDAISAEVSRLPVGKLVNTGSSPGGNNIAWRSMQGTLYGVGSGEQVSKDLERRNSWPKYKR